MGELGGAPEQPTPLSFISRILTLSQVPLFGELQETKQKIVHLQAPDNLNTHLQDKGKKNYCTQPEEKLIYRNLSQVNDTVKHNTQSFWLVSV